MLHNKRLLIGILSFLGMLAMPVLAGSHFYGDTLGKAKWRTSGNRLECRLTQMIPGYGKASFTHHSLQSMQFRVSSNYVPRKPSQALVFISPPIWKRYANRTVLGRVPLTAQKDTIIIPEDWAYRMALELREGMEAVWSHSDWADGNDIITAKVLPIKFGSAWEDFLQCGENLLDYGYNDIRFKAFYFGKKSMKLSLKEKRYLNRLAEYALLDTDFQYIKLNSHTDSRGVRGKNLAVSRQRANMVKSYLVKQGISAKRFVISARGEKKPKYNNRTQSGRAKNRRVEVMLVK